MSKKVLFTSLIVYVLCVVGTYGVLGYTSASQLPGTTTPTQDQNAQDPAADDQTALGLLLEIDPAEPKDQPCPLNGKLYTMTEKNAWEQRRPLAVMIENTPDARPQSGISDADIVFEAVAEYGITRYMGIFYCEVQTADTTLAPVRSARTYFIDWASGFNYPLYTHVGGANIPGKTDALGQLNQYGWAGQNNLNQFSIGYPTFVRNANRIGREVATEHTMETSTEKLWAVATKRKWTNMSPDIKVGGKTIAGTDWKDGYESWSFEESATPGTASQTISYDFWKGDENYAVKWIYDAQTSSYSRELGGAKHVDLNDDSQVKASNVVVLFTKEEGPINELKHMLYQTTGTGKVLIFKNGEAVEASWSKKTREAELEFLDKAGKPIEMARGLTWISVLDTATQKEVQY